MAVAQVLAYVGLLMAVSAILHWKWSDSEIEHTKQKLLADQRGVAAELGPRWLPLRQRIEGWITALAKDAGPEVIDARGSPSGTSAPGRGSTSASAPRRRRPPRRSERARVIRCATASPPA